MVITSLNQLEKGFPEHSLLGKKFTPLARYGLFYIFGEGMTKAKVTNPDIIQEKRIS